MVWWQNSPIGVWLAVYDLVTGVFLQQSKISGGTQLGAFRLVVLGTKVLVLAMGTGGATNLQSTVFDSASPTVAPANLANIETDVYGGSFTFDAFAYNNQTAIVAYARGAAGTDIGLIGVGPAGTVLASPASTTIAGAAGAAGLTRAILLNRDTAGNIYLVFADASNNSTSFYVLSSSFAITVARTAIVTTGNWDGTTADALIGVSVESATNQVTFVLTNTNTIITSTITDYLGKVTLGPAGIVTAFAVIPSTQGMFTACGFVSYDGTFVFGAVNLELGQLVAGTTYESLQSTAWILDINGKVVARALEDVSGISISIACQRCSQGYASAGPSASFVFIQQGRTDFVQLGSSVVNTSFLGVAKVTITKSSTQALPIIKLGETIYIGGGQPRTYDGTQVVEAGFALAPTVSSITPNGGGSGSLSAGTYGMSFVYAWTNAKGELVRGPPSVPVSKVAVNTGSLVAVVLTMPESMRDLLPAGASVFIEGYRTTANGSVYYRDNIYGSTGALNSTTATTITINSTSSDASLQVGELLYTTGGILDWEAPPPYSMACAHKNRLIVVSSENPYSWWPSSEWSPQEMVRFSGATASFIPSDRGPLAACASMDGKLILFAQNGAYVVIGDGPDLFGNNNYPPAERITSVDAGPLPGTPIVSTPMGLMYQGPTGIMLLDRGLNVQFIGNPVQAFSSGAYRVRSALVDAERQEVRFLADPGTDLTGAMTGAMVPSDGGVGLVYSYYYEQWSVLEPYGGVSACLYQGNYTLGSSNGYTASEAPGIFRDDGGYYSKLFETPWIKFAGVQGFQRIWYATVLGTYQSDCTFQWEVAFDYEGTAPAVPTWTTLVSLDGTGVYALGGPFQCRQHIGHKCEAVKFRFTETNVQGTGEGINLTDLTLELGVKRGAFRLPASKTA